MKYTLTIMTVFILCFLEMNAQFYNDGAMVIIQPDALLHIQGDFINQGGEITNEGLIELGGDWVNTVMTPPLTPNAGTVSLQGSNQSIGGDFPTLFHNVSVDQAQNITLTSSIGIGNSIELNDGIITLDRNVLHLLSPEPEALTFNEGGVIAETSDNYGFVRWDLAETAPNSYTIPFINSLGNSVPLSYELQGTGVGDLGFLLFSTYGSEEDNSPLPIGVTNLNVSDDNTGLTLVDRFYVVESMDYTTSPTGSVTLSYDETSEIGGNNTIATDRLETLIWDTLDGWMSFNQNTTTNNSVQTVIDTQYGTYTLWSNTSTSVNDFQELEGFGVYPNPTTSVATAEYIAPVTEKASLSIINSVGKKIFNQSVQLTDGEMKKIELDLSDQPDGLYHIHIESESLRSSKMIIKQ